MSNLHYRLKMSSYNVVKDVTNFEFTKKLRKKSDMDHGS